MHRFLVCSFTLVLMVGCGSKSSANGPGGGGTSGTDDGGTGSGADDGGTWTDGTSTGGTSTGSTGTTGTGTGSCPPREDVFASFSISPDPGMNDYRSICTLGEIDVDSPSGTTTIEMTCAAEGGGTEAITLEYRAKPLAVPHFVQGDEVELEYIADPIFWINRWFAIRSADGEHLYAAGVDGSAIDPPGSTLSEFLVGPELELVDPSCAPTPDECGPITRLAFDLTYGDQTTRVYDHGGGVAGHLSSCTLALEFAYSQKDMQVCSDVPGSWYKMVLMTVPEG